MKATRTKDMENAPNRQMKLLQSLQLTIILLVVASFANGCAMIPRSVELSYSPQSNVEKIKGADAVKVKVEISNATRWTNHKISAVRNTYGEELADIRAKNNVYDTVKKALELELKNRGFESGEKSVLVLVELRKYYCQFTTHFFLGSAVAEAIMNVKVMKADRSVLYSKEITGTNSQRAHRATGENARVTLDAALGDAISKLFGDTLFIDSLFKASQQGVEVPSKPQLPVTEKKKVPAFAPSPPSTDFVVVTGTSANIRTGAGNEFPIVTTVNQGTKLTLLGEYGNWLNVRLENGQEGWINSRFVQE